MAKRCFSATKPIPRKNGLTDEITAGEKSDGQDTKKQTEGEINFLDHWLLPTVPEREEDKTGEDGENVAGHAGKGAGKGRNEIGKQGVKGVRTAEFSEGKNC